MSLLNALEHGKAAQVGVIVFGGGLNLRFWIEKARQDGYLVRICNGYAELYRIER